MKKAKEFIIAKIGEKNAKMVNVLSLVAIAVILLNIVLVMCSHCWKHNYIATVTEPTCLTDGYTTYVCEKCGDTYTGDNTPALGHDFVLVEAQKATCTENGWETYHECSRCGAVSDYVEIPATGHTFTNYVYNNDATCTENGTKTAKCDICGATDTVTVDGTALGHNYGEFKVTVAATIDRSGVKTQTCSRCGATNRVSFDVSTEYKNALKKAESYSKHLSMSKRAIYEQLTSEYGEGFSADAAQYAIDNMTADWNANALEKAKSYQKHLNMSKSAIYSQLISEYGEKFTASEAQYAIDHLDD